MQFIKLVFFQASEKEAHEGRAIKDAQDDQGKTLDHDQLLERVRYGLVSVVFQALTHCMPHAS